ncbi:MAG: M23 family metallopeptidase, partial [Gloeobacteraceae cyanobacterium ES-bin-316]|nr:M23 family metallopeptidase [Ferruginibacter sp.]
AKVALVANFGELRPNHFHMGLDCRTEQVENKPVYAAAAGYIAKVKIEPWGFGRALYVNHPNGMTSLYAHLNDFYPALEAYIKKQQYLLQKWNVFLDIPANLFPVNKGSLIAYSGNTGGSQGPHVHFEIRDTKTDNVLNPLLMGFPIADNIAPDILRLAVYDRCKSTYEQTPKIYPLKKINGVYVPASGKLTVNTEKVSFAITAYDRYTGSTNQNGIYEATLFDNNIAVAGFQLDSISYLDTRYLNAHIDYKFRAGGGSYLQHLSKLPGNQSDIYKTSETNGVINFEEEKEHAIKIVVADPNGNSSTVQFAIASLGNSSIGTAGKAQDSKEFYPGFVNIFENDRVHFYLNENALYDSFNFRYNETKDAKGKTVYQVHNATVPLHNYFNLKIKEDFSLIDMNKIVMFRSYGAKKDYVKASYGPGGWYHASFREMGNFQLLVDSIPPVVSAPGFFNNMNAAKLNRLLFVVTDNTEEIENFTAMLDGKWLRFSNDKGRNFIYKFDEHCPPGEHELMIRVEDQVGNMTQKTYNFRR